MITTDLHIHSHYTKLQETILDFKQLSKNAELKGITVLSTGDCLHPKWLKEIRQLDEVDYGTYQYNNTRFILSTEIETIDKVHHLLFFPDITSIYDFKEKISLYSENLETDGRPTIQLSSQEIIPYVFDVNALIGPSHIFNQISGIYTHYNSIYDCYGPYHSHISFIELGLGMDTYLADKIKELHKVTFLSNSDSHNPHPIRLGREFTILKVKEPTYNEIRNALLRKKGNKPLLNVGFPPEEGKYYESACSKCFKHYTYESAKRKKWKCKCGSIIKKGIRHKVKEKSDFKKPQHPYHRPLYLTILPLHEILTRTLNEQNPFTPRITQYWDKLISTFGDEIHVTLETPINDIAKTTLPSIAEAIQSFRMATIKFQPGGGGEYGTLIVPWEENYLLFSLKNNNINQKTIQVKK
jgi:uncharacterized protein (TIGR00375 family)